MLKYALFDYIPKRKMRKATFEQQDTTRKVLDFKAGKSYATSWAARQMARAIRHNDLSDTIIVCIPASCKRTNDRRYKQFMRELCELTGAINGFGHWYSLWENVGKHTLTMCMKSLMEHRSASTLTTMPLEERKCLWLMTS